MSEHWQIARLQFSGTTINSLGANCCAKAERLTKDRNHGSTQEKGVEIETQHETFS